jgi:predicted alpha/beta hydrolase family esterase
MKQILVIHGGTTYSSYDDFLESLKNSTPNYERLLASRDWKATLKSHFPNDDILLPSMPNAQNAKYAEWKIVFEKISPLLFGDYILVGHSLGGIFLAKYLHENQLPTIAEKIIFVAAPYNDESGESLGDFKLTTSTGVERSAKEVHFFFSEDDPIVQITERSKFVEDIPSATFHTLQDRKHFWQEQFPELVELIKK